MLLLFFKLWLVISTLENCAKDRSRESTKTMLRETFAHIRVLSLQFPDPPRADRAMHKLICSNLKLSRRVLTRNLLRRLLNLSVGTNDVMKCASMIMRQNVRNHYDEKLIRDMMRSKVKGCRV